PRCALAPRAGRGSNGSHAPPHRSPPVFVRPAAVALPAVLAAGIALAPSAPVPAARQRSDWPMLGGTPARNMANLADRDAPASFDPGSGKGVLWTAHLGSKVHGGPVVAGKVFVGTNNARPRNPRNPRDTRKGADGDIEPLDKGVL